MIDIRRWTTRRWSTLRAPAQVSLAATWRCFPTSKSWRRSATVPTRPCARCSWTRRHRIRHCASCRLATSCSTRLAGLDVTAPPRPAASQSASDEPAVGRPSLNNLAKHRSNRRALLVASEKVHAWYSEQYLMPLNEYRSLLYIVNTLPRVSKKQDTWFLPSQMLTDFNFFHL